MPLDLATAGHLKERLIGMVCRTSGVFLTQNHAILSDRMTNMPLPYSWTNMPFETLLENVTGKKLNLWINVWQDSYRFAMRRQALCTASSAGLTATTAGVAPVIYTPGVAPGSRRRLSGDTSLE